MHHIIKIMFNYILNYRFDFYLFIFLIVFLEPSMNCSQLNDNPFIIEPVLRTLGYNASNNIKNIYNLFK